MQDTGSYVTFKKAKKTQDKNMTKKETAMKRPIAINKVPRGEVFTAFDEDFVVLDHVDGGVFCIRKEVWKRDKFDDDCCNNLREAGIRDTLSEYRSLLKDRGAKDEDIIPIKVDLKATDGTRLYGWYEGDVGLLTLEQYGKYKEIIPLVDGWWWLATPVWTRWLRSPYTSYTDGVWYVSSGGDYGVSGASDSWGVRPVLIFSAALLVSWDDGESDQERREQENKKAAFADYCRYVKEWAEDREDDPGDFTGPDSFSEWYEHQWKPHADQ